MSRVLRTLGHVETERMGAAAVAVLTALCSAVDYNCRSEERFSVVISFCACNDDTSTIAHHASVSLL